jgi:hypothetical protein
MMMGTPAVAGSQHFADFEPADFGQHQIEHDEAGRGGPGLRQRFGAVRRGDHGKTGLLQIEFDQLNRFRLVIDHEDFRSHSGFRYHADSVTTTAGL